MSFIDSIVNGVQSVLGIGDDDTRPPQRDEPARAQPGDGRPASKVATGFSSRAATGGAGSGTDRFSRAVRAMDTARAQPPHVGGDRSQSPPLTAFTDGGNALGRARARAEVYDASGAAQGSKPAYLGDASTLRSGDDASVAARNVQYGLDYFANRFDRDGLDGRGSTVNVLVGDTTPDSDPSSQSAGDELFRGNGGYFAMRDSSGVVTEAVHYGRGLDQENPDGRRVVQRSMAHADDLAVHELTHGVIKSETGSYGGGADEAGATNEAVADVLAAAATRDWRIGEGMYTAESDVRLMRNIARPRDSDAFHELATSVSDVRRKTGAGEAPEEHWASGVISTAAYRVHQRLGGDEPAWRAIEQVFYDTIREHRLGDMSFEAVAAGIRASAASRWGTGSGAYAAFDEELQRGGL